MEIKIISWEEINVCRGCENYLFGASDRGKKILKELMERNVEVAGIWDNDPYKQGEKIENVPIISYEELKKHNNINLLLGCAYAKQEEQRIDDLAGVSVYQIGRTHDELERYFQKDVDYFPAYIEETRQLQHLYADNLSRETADALVRYITNYEGGATFQIASVEEHYFINEVLTAINGRKLVYVDCGAFTGELPSALKKLGIEYSKCYCFEMDGDNLVKAKEILLKENLLDKVILEQCGVGDRNGYVYYEKKSASSRIVDYETSDKVKLTTINTYFKDIHIDFVKMDIEGAEFGALNEGMTVIKRDRPILAISVYHSLQDRTRIFKYLYDNLSGYKYYLRQHSITPAETVLYAIPM